MNLNAEDYFIAGQAERRLKELRSRWADRLVTITHGKYEGYKGVVKGVDLEAADGRWIFLVYVISKDGTRMLNSDTETRMYRPLWHFAVEDERWEPTSRQGKKRALDDIWFPKG